MYLVKKTNMSKQRSISIPKKVSVVEMNEHLARFMGIRRGRYNKWVTQKGMPAMFPFRFHKDWEWLMGVVEKLEKNYDARIRIDGSVVEINPTAFNAEVRVSASSKMVSLHRAVYEFIKKRDIDYEN